MEDGDEEVLYQTELVQLFSEEDEVYIKWSHGPKRLYQTCYSLGFI